MIEQARSPAGILHQLSNKVEEYGIRQVLTATCSCGWAGQPWGASHDYQMFMLNTDKQRHMREVEQGVFDAIPHGS